MKVKEFAETQGISTQAVYQRLKNFTKKKNTKLSDYVSGDTSEITEEGYKVLQSLYKQPVKQREPRLTVDSKHISELSTEVETQKVLINSLQTRLQDKEKEIARLEEALAHERETCRLLLESLPKAKPEGFFRRLFPGRQDKTATTGM